MTDRDRYTDGLTDESSPIRGALGGEETVGRLIRLADAGPEIPADGADRVRERIRPVWRREVRARSRRRYLWAAGWAAAAAAVLAVALIFPDSASTPVDTVSVARVAVVVGAVEVLSPSGAEFVVDEGGDTADIQAGSRLTTGRGSRAAFVLVGGGSLRMDASSEVVVESPSRLFLHRGAVYLDSDGEESPQTEVRTVFGTAREVGTQFEVRRSLDELVVRVREGMVEVVRGSVEYEVSLGAMLRLAADGSHTVGTIATYGDEWDWVQSVAPVFEIEGRTAAQLLDWVSRETGLWVSYASLEVEEEARRTVLHGNIEGVAPAQAPALVLPGCGLRAEFGAGTLTVDREP